MADTTKIEWTDATWNAIRGCTRVTEGCRHRYAEAMAARFSDPGQWGHGLATREPNRWTGKVILDEATLLKPLRWRKPRRIFVTSIGDPFHEDVPDDWLDRLFAVMALTSQHTYQLLTKRPARMREYLRDMEERAYNIEQAEELDAVSRDADGFDDAMTASQLRAVAAYEECNGRLVDMARGIPLPNVWLGTSVSVQADADRFVPDLLATPAARRFVSTEPLLGHVDMTRYIKRLDWVIVGGESGPQARPMHPDWARDLRDQCADAGTPFLFKQWGEWAPGECCGPARRMNTAATWDLGRWFSMTYSARAVEEMHRDDQPDVWRVGKREAGRLLDGVLHDAFPETSR